MTSSLIDDLIMNIGEPEKSDPSRNLGNLVPILERDPLLQGLVKYSMEIRGRTPSTTLDTQPRLKR